MRRHRQVWVKINAFVDEGVAGLIEALSAFQGIRTLQSCQGHIGRHPISIWFTCGEDGREAVLEFAEWFGPALWEAIGDTARFTVYWSSLNGTPKCLLEVRQEGAELAIQALQDLAARWILPSGSARRRNLASSCGKGGTGLGN